MSTELITTDERPVANDLRHAMMTLPVDSQTVMLGEYYERRQNFREWLLSKLVEGTHYGFVPGCEPKSRVKNGVTEYAVWNKWKNDYDWHPESQWKPKPSLYAAGADFICDLMGVRDEYESDPVAWQQMGSKAGTAVQKCRLFSRATGEIVGEAIGAYYSQYDANNAVKMASKCAKVGAVINAYGLRDLFTQDAPQGPPNDNPEANTTAPKTAPRAKREAASAEGVKPEHIKDILGNWRGLKDSVSNDPEKDRRNYIAWVAGITGREFDALKVSQWRKADVVACCGALGILNPWEETP